jgi:hypothetical protein
LQSKERESFEKYHEAGMGKNTKKQKSKSKKQKKAPSSEL